MYPNAIKKRRSVDFVVPNIYKLPTWYCVVSVCARNDVADSSSWTGLRYDQHGRRSFLLVRGVERARWRRREGEESEEETENPLCAAAVLCSCGNANFSCSFSHCPSRSTLLRSSSFRSRLCAGCLLCRLPCFLALLLLRALPSSPVCVRRRCSISLERLARFFDRSLRLI